MNNFCIKSIKARQIIDSRGNPTVEADVELNDGSIGRASVPSGASTGALEAVELRDGDKQFYNGKGVSKAVNAINGTISRELTGDDARDQLAIDRKMILLDGTENKRNIGANSILAVSLATAKAAAQSCRLPLYRYLGGTNSKKMPVPMINILNGGMHANNAIDIQEFMIMPVSAASMSDAIRIGSEVFHALGEKLSNDGYTTGVGDEGGFAPELEDSFEVLDYIMSSVEKAGYKPYEDIVIALDVAATSFYNKENNLYSLKGEHKDLGTEELIEFYEQIISRYPVKSIEDPIHEDDYEGWKILTDQLSGKVQIVGDDLFVTNSKILEEGMKKGLANAILIKPNQIGTLSETLTTVEKAKTGSYNTIISHRSGETEDTTIAHIAVATNSGQIKTGSMCRSDRLAKYNELIRIEEDLKGSAVFSAFS